MLGTRKRLLLDAGYMFIVLALFLIGMIQLLLAIRGCGIEGGPRITEIAEYLVVRHHTAVEIIDRAERAGLVRRAIDPIDSRAVRVQLTDEGQERLAALTRQHLDELQQFLPVLSRLDQGLPDSDGPLVDRP